MTLAYDLTRADALDERLPPPCGHTAGCGCEWAGCCLDCPLLRCKYEDPSVSLKAMRNAEIAASREAGLTAVEIAERFEVSTRTVARAVA